jgi:apolipoprotein N-acyltransferase
MQLGHQKVAVNICYEDVFGEEIISQLPQATMLVNISNDAWYGQSFAAEQHMQFSQARAIETGRMVLRSTNTGATAIIDQHGMVVAHAPHFTQTILTGQAQGYTGTTPYVRWGNWLFLLISFVSLGWILKRRIAAPPQI